MRQIRFKTIALGLALVLAACGSTTPNVQPSASSGSAASPPASSRLDEAARKVLDAALATQTAGTLHFHADVRSADRDDARPPATADGWLAFDEPLRFRFGSPGVGEDAIPSEVIFDGKRVFIRGRDVAFVPTDRWVVVDSATAGDAAVEAYLRQYGVQALVLVPPLGVTSARPDGTETIAGVETNRFVVQVDVEQAREYVPEHLRPLYDAQMETFRQIGTFPTHELDVWVDPDGRIVRTRYEHVASESLGETLAVTNEFANFGGALDLAPPAGAEVLTLDEARNRYLPASPRIS
jgi:hypothetical protein